MTTTATISPVPRSLARASALSLLVAAPLAVPGVVRAQATKLRLPAALTESGAESIYVQEGGFFAAHGLDVDISIFSSGGQITNALAGGALDVGWADSIQLGNAVNRGIPFGYIAGGIEYSTNAPTTLLCVPKNGNIKAARDLEGQAIAVNGLGSMAEFSSREFVRQAGGDGTKLKFVEVPPSAIIPAIVRGTVGAGVVSEPNLSLAADNDLIPLAKVFDYCAKSFYINAYFAKREWVATNPDLARKVIAALYDGARWANTHHAETAAILAKWAKIAPERIAKMNRGVYDTGLDPKKIQPALDIAWRYHGFEKPVLATDLILRV